MLSRSISKRELSDKELPIYSHTLGSFQSSLNEQAGDERFSLWHQELLVVEPFSVYRKRFLDYFTSCGLKHPFYSLNVCTLLDWGVDVFQPYRNIFKKLDGGNGAQHIRKKTSDVVYL